MTHQPTSTSNYDFVVEHIWSWRAEPDNLFHLRTFPTISLRLAYVTSEPDLHTEKNTITYENDAAVISKNFVNIGVPLRNQINELEMEWGSSPLVLTLRETDSFGEVLIELYPAQGRATVYSITIDRILKGGVSYSSPSPEEQMIKRVGRYTFAPIGAGMHQVVLKAIEEKVSLMVDGTEILSFDDPDVAGGCVGIGSWETIRLRSWSQDELITPEEAKWRADFVRNMTDFCKELDAERDADIAKVNDLTIHSGRLIWRYPETGTTLSLNARPGSLNGDLYAGLYGNPRMLAGPFALPEIVDVHGNTYHIDPDKLPAFEGDNLHFAISIPIRSDSGDEASMTLLAKFTENMVWFWTAEVHGLQVRRFALAFGMDRDFKPNWAVNGSAGEPAKLAWGTATLVPDDAQGVSGGVDTGSARSGFGLGKPDENGLTTSLICTDAVTGHVWKALSGQDTKFEVKALGTTPAIVLHSEKPKFRWATMFMPYHKLNLTGYKKRMVHFIRQPEEPYSNWRERPSKFEYPTDEELERYASNGVKAMVWHHTWTGNNSRQRDGFVVNEKEMSRAMKKTHELGMETIPYIGIVPGRHPVLRYNDLSTRMFYDKNWDLQDFTFYSVAGRFQDFFPYITDYWCREYGIDGFYTDGGLALLDWGYTGLSEEDFDGMSLEELNDRLYSRVKRVLRRHGARFGLENWGGAPIHLAGPWYDCRMIGEAFHEAAPEKYRDGYNPLLTSTPFKMYAANLESRNKYNIAMAGVCMTDLQLCSGNYSWGCWPDMPSDYLNIRPFWDILNSIDWDNLIDARPWWAQKLVEGEDIYAGYYMTPDRVVFFIANRREDKRRIRVRINLEEVPESLRSGNIRLIYPEAEEWIELGKGELEIDLPRLHAGPLGYEIVK